jgi:uncharacterized protein YbbC (DUF1343 family)
MFAPMVKMKLLITCWFAVLITSCQSQEVKIATKVMSVDKAKVEIVCGAQRLEQVLGLLKNKRVALLVNQTAMVSSSHLVDTLAASNINIKKIFAPEHGFRGEADAGDRVANTTDKKTGIAIISMYGDKKKPSNQDMKDVDVVVFDIQDVGARFYTFI